MRFVILLSLLAAFSQAEAEIYKWVDGQGVTHYSEKPPASGRAKKFQLRQESESVGAADAGQVKTDNANENRLRLEKEKKLLRAMSEDRRQEKQKRQREEKITRQRIRNCAIAKDSLRRYESSTSVYKVDDKGNRVILPSTERDKSIQHARAQVKKWCGQ